MVKIGSLVEFIDNGSRFRGTINSIENGNASISVVGHSQMFIQPIARLVAMTESSVPDHRPKTLLHD
jgi:hypothetical protein